MSFQQQRHASQPSTVPFYPLSTNDAGESQYDVTPDEQELPLQNRNYPESSQSAHTIDSRPHYWTPHQQLDNFTCQGNVYGTSAPVSPTITKGKEPAMRSNSVSSPNENDETIDKRTHRRIQNRLSQRAYRSRKDKLIETLQQRVEDQVESRKLMVELCNKKIDSCIEVLNTQVQELRTLQSSLVRDVTPTEDTRQRDENESMMDIERSGYFDMSTGMEMGVEFDANAWGYRV